MTCMVLHLDLILETQNKWVWKGSLEVSSPATMKPMANQVFCAKPKSKALMPISSTGFQVPKSSKRWQSHG